MRSNCAVFPFRETACRDSRSSVASSIVSDSSIDRVQLDDAYSLWSRSSRSFVGPEWPKHLHRSGSPRTAPLQLSFIALRVPSFVSARRLLLMSSGASLWTVGAESSWPPRGRSASAIAGRTGFRAQTHIQGQRISTGRSHGRRTSGRATAGGPREQVNATSRRAVKNFSAIQQAN
jgi:hypothetical protein